MNNFKSHNPDELNFDDLEQLVNDPEAQAAIDEQFGAATDELNDGVSRRRWLQLMGASLALGGAAGCRFQEEKIAPYVFRPHNRVPGDTVQYATMIDFGGVAVNDDDGLAHGGRTYISRPPLRAGRAAPLAIVAS